MSSSVVKIAHISDIHLQTKGPVRLADLASKRLLGYLNHKHNRGRSYADEHIQKVLEQIKAEKVDHIICTGDLINIGLPSEISRARQWLEELGPPERVSVIPGNHDAYVASAIPDFERSWRDYFGLPKPDEEFLFPYIRKIGSVALIGVSSAIATGYFKATGRIGEAQLERLSHALHETQEAGFFRLIAMHHPPTALKCPSYKQLLDRDRFNSVIAQHGAELILHGHTHVPNRSYLVGPNNNKIPVYGVSAASKLIGKDTPLTSLNIFSILDNKLL